MSSVPFEAISILPIPFTGCLRKLTVNNIRIPLNESSIKISRNIGDCDGTPCGGEFCYNGGTCWLDSNLIPHCTCIDPYYGDQCEILPPCDDFMCKNRGRCIAQSCSCSIGWTGAFCENSIIVNYPKFSGNSYIILNKTYDKKRQASNLDFKNLHLNFSTANSEGLLLWRNQVRCHLLIKGFQKLFSRTITSLELVWKKVSLKLHMLSEKPTKT